jgi:E3 ubiquitin-protein ligase HUWE1
MTNRETIRLNRPPIYGSFGGNTIDRGSAGSFGWTDDGLPVDNIAQEFSSALVGTFEEIARAAMVQLDENINMSVTIDEIDTPQNAAPSAGFEESVQPSEVVNTAESTSESTIIQTATELSTYEVEDGMPSDGEGVVSSVAELRLSAESEDAEHQRPIDANATIAAMSDNRMSDQRNVDIIDVSSVNVLGQVDVNITEDNMEVENPVRNSVRDESPPRDIDNATLSSVFNMGEDISQPTNSLGDGNEVQETITSNGLVCPPDVDVGVFHSLPLELQQDCVNQYSATQELAAQLNGSTLDPEVLAALPEEMRREIIEQDRQERRIRAQEDVRADPSNAVEMDNASFLASLSPDLREEILLTADQEFLNSLPPGVVAEAHILRERASVTNRRQYETTSEVVQDRGNANSGTGLALPSQETANEDSNGLASRRRQRSGKVKVDKDRDNVVFVSERLSSPFAVADLKVLFKALYLLTPVQPTKVLPKIFLNLCSNAKMRDVVISTIVCLLGEDYQGALLAIESLSESYEPTDNWKATTDVLFSIGDKFPPATLIGISRDTTYMNDSDLRPVTGSAATLAMNLPKNNIGDEANMSGLPHVIATRLMDLMLHLCKNPRVCLHLLSDCSPSKAKDVNKSTLFDQLLELLEKSMFSNSSNNLETLLSLFEAVLTPLSHISRPLGEDEPEIPERDIEAAALAGKEYIDVPQVVISQRRLQLLCSILRMESCRDTAFTRVNTIIRRLCRVETNRGYVLAELASVAHALGSDALRDLRALRIRLDDAAARHQLQLSQRMDIDKQRDITKSKYQEDGFARSISSSVTLSTSTSESKLLRVLQTLQVLCNDSGDDNAAKKNDNTVIVTDELAHLLRHMNFSDLWDELSGCLKVVQILEGVRTFEETEQNVSEDLDTNDDGSTEDVTAKNKKLRNSAAGLLSRFLPSIEAFFIANACATRPSSDTVNKTTNSDTEISIESLVGGHRMLEFVSAHRVLVNALIRNNYSLLEKGFRALVQVPRCRGLLDFDVKRQWFKSQVRRLRQHASRRHGSLRLQIRRKSVFEDAYHQLQPRNADEMRGRLHVTFRNEEGVDAGGLSREFFGILAKEMFNPNYALFTSTEDGCTFQPNPNSMINPDHLSYFRFVGRVVGKAVADGYLLDAHFTRSLYKHMLGIQPTHHDMEAIDPDYYRNLKTILEYNLADIGLDLTFSIEDHSFGRSQVIDLLPNGRSVPVTEENKEEYVRLVCQHRMTTSIQSQIKSYLAGFYELVSLDLIAIFSPKELELLISGLPDIDVHDLKEHTDYVGWKSTDKEIVWFWNIVFGLGRNEKASFLQFVTGSSKVPLSGFAELQGMRGIQKFSIHKMNGKKGALMSAHTCFNSLDLPSYDNEDEMRQKFLLAINEGGGAFLFA